MKQDSRTALILLLIGLVSLFTYSAVYSPTTYDPRELQEDHVGEIVRLHGMVNDMNVNNGVTFIRLERRPGLDIVSFDQVQAIEQNSTVTIDGTVDLYHGQLEVLVDSIVVEDD